MQKNITKITDKIIKRSVKSRAQYLEKIEAQKSIKVRRGALSCSNLAHGFAASSPIDKQRLTGEETPNIGIITSYNDMLSAHQPYEKYPAFIRQVAQDLGATAQVAGGVPAMCDGVTQGQEGMDLSLFSRDLIAMSCAIALSHNMFDSALYLGICDKIVPGMLIAALNFGQMPAIFIPAGPMSSGMPNEEKARIRELYAQGKIGKKQLLEAEAKSYHSAGTCTFYGTANSNQMLMEFMGLQLPGSSFVAPNTPLRGALTKRAIEVALNTSAIGKNYIPIANIIDEKSIVNGLVGLNATGGSTNHAIHLIAIAKAAGIIITWQDMEDISEITPLLTRIYPNGYADINQFNSCGGLGFIIGELLENGLLHQNVTTILGKGLDKYAAEARLNKGELEFTAPPKKSGNEKILVKMNKAFAKTGGLKLLKGNLGEAIIKISALKDQHKKVKAPAKVFHTQDELMQAFKQGKMDKDMVAVVRFNGPKANGMPELHKLSPYLGVLQERGFKVALLTDGRMSGASGKIPAAIHLSPEALTGGNIAKIKNGDMILLDANKGVLELLVDEKELEGRKLATHDLSQAHIGMGRELFSGFRELVGGANKGATIFD